MGALIDQLLVEEMRNAEGVPERYQILDFLGIGLGTWFIIETLRRRDPNWINVGLGTVMIYIHAQRFVLAPPAGIEP